MKLYLSKEEARVIINSLTTSAQDLKDQVTRDKPSQKIIELCENGIANRQKIINYLEYEMRVDDEIPIPNL